MNYLIKNSKSFDYKTSITGKLEDNNVEKDDVITAVSLKYLSNFLRTLDIPLINCEVSLTLTWSENCVITSKAAREADPDADPAVSGINNPTNAILKIKDTKLYIPVITLSAENDYKLLEQLKAGFKRTIKWNKYRSEMSNQTKNYNLNYLIDSKFTNVNRLFLASITVTNPNNDAYDKKFAFKNNAPFTSAISKINSTLIDNAEEQLNGINIGRKCLIRLKITI